MPGAFVVVDVEAHDRHYDELKYFDNLRSGITKDARNSTCSRSSRGGDSS